MAHRFEATGDFEERLEGKVRRQLVPSEEIVSRLEVSRRDLVVDLGAGIGYFASLIAERARTVIAVDIDLRMLDVLSKRIRLRGTDNIVPIRAEITSIPLSCESVDHVLGAFVYHEVGSTKKLLDEASRILRPEGRLTIVDFQKRETPIGPPVGERRTPEQVVRKASSRFRLESRFETEVYYQLGFEKL
ncbi:MAG: class I SAM-dependent methyltransferase [Thermoplasmata archaeon]